MKNYSKTDFVISNFSSLERQLQDCMEYIPFIDANKQAISPKFIPIITEACGLIESIFKEITVDDSGKYNLKKYSQLHEDNLSLEVNKSLFLGTPLRVLEPYRGWTKQQPEWWQAYNSLKHDRLNNYNVATYTNAVLALTGLHQLMAKCKIFIGGFLKAGWIDTQSLDILADLSSAAHLGPLHPGPPSMIIESTLFVSPSDLNFIQNSSDDDLLYLEIDDSIPGLSERVKDFIFAHEGW
jgi:hypothetical protein